MFSTHCRVITTSSNCYYFLILHIDQFNLITSYTYIIIITAIVNAFDYPCSLYCKYKLQNFEHLHHFINWYMHVYLHVHIFIPDHAVYVSWIHSGHCCSSLTGGHHLDHKYILHPYNHNTDCNTYYKNENFNLVIYCSVKWLKYIVQCDTVKASHYTPKIICTCHQQ